MRVCTQCQERPPRPGVGRRTSWCDPCHTAWEIRRSKPEAQVKLRERFEGKISSEDECWVWQGAKSDTGYGSLGVEGKTCHAHRIAYEFWVGPIPPRKTIDHLCRNRACVRPEHLEAVSPKENSAKGLLGVLKKECAQGHPWTPEHIYDRPGSNKRMCGTCNRERSRARHRTKIARRK